MDLAVVVDQVVEPHQMGSALSLAWLQVPAEWLAG
jgi:hypothetical protein